MTGGAGPLLRRRQILILAPSEWRDNAVSNMQIAAELSVSNTVAYVETPGGRMPRRNELGRALRRLKRILRGPRRGGGARGLDARNVHILSPFCIPLHGRPPIDRLNRALLLYQVRRFMRRLGMRRPLVWSFSPVWQPVAERIDAAVRVFHCVDGLHTYDASPAFRRRLEAAVRAADVVFTPGIVLYEELRRLNANTHRIGHGCGPGHLDYADDGAAVAELRAVPEPRVVYAGTLANWFDYELLVETARRLPDVSFVLIGYVHALAPREQVAALLALANVHAVGYRNYDRLPAFYRCAAVGIVPYRADNEHIRYSTPTKFLDYLAAALPVVSTRYPAAEEMSAFVAVADTAEDFARAIRQALATDSEEKRAARRAFARDRSWPRQVARMSAEIVRTMTDAPAAG